MILVAQKRMEALLEKGLEDLSTEYATHLAKTCPHVQDYLQQSMRFLVCFGV